MRKLIWVLCIAAAFSGAAVADEGHHHDELAPDQLGTVHFPVSCTPDAQKTFEKGVALLHSFWYEEAAKTFLDVEKQDPKRFNGLYGAARAAEMAGQASQATEYYAVLVKTCEGSSSERPELAKAKQAVVAQK
jgi:hypothetical protein